MGATVRRLRRPVTDQTGVGGTAPRARACPGQLSAASVFVQIRTPLAAPGRVGLTVVTARMHRAPAPQPQQAPERRPGPPAGCPPCRAGRPGAPSAHLSHFARRVAHTAPMAATAVHVCSPGRRAARRLPRVGDDRLVARVRAGDDAAFEIIYDRYYRGLLAFCGHMLGSRHEAEDALQHSFASAYRALRGGAGDSSCAPGSTRSRATAASRSCARGARRSPPTGCAADRPVRGRCRPGPAPRRPARARRRPAAPARRPARGAGPLRARRRVPRADRGGARRAPREGQGARLPGARGAAARTRRRARRRASRSASSSPRHAAAAPRRSVARSHLDRCAGCAEFEREVRRQRAALAAILPLAPTVGLKASVLGFALGGGGARRPGRRGRAAERPSPRAARSRPAASAVAEPPARRRGRRGRLGTAGAATVATGLATGGGGVGLASLPAKGVVAKILSVVALGGGGAEVQVHSHRLPRQPAIHQSVLRPSTTAPSYPPSPRAAPAGLSARRRPAGGVGRLACRCARPLRNAARVVAVARADCLARSRHARPRRARVAIVERRAARDGRRCRPQRPAAATPAPATAAPASAPVGAAAPTASVAATSTDAPAPVPAAAPTPSASTPPAGPSTESAGTPATAAAVADSAASAAAVAAS